MANVAKAKKKAVLSNVEETENDKQDNFYKGEAVNFADPRWNEVSDMFGKLLKIIHEKDIDAIKAIADSDNQSAWFLGDKVNEIAIRAASSSATSYYTYNDICYFVAGLSGRNYSTVKGYAVTARRFTQEIREAFSHRDVPFSHFVYAGNPKFSTANPETGNLFWRDILEFSYLNSLEAGKNTTKQQLLAKFENKVYDPAKLKGFKLGSVSGLEGYVEPISISGTVDPEKLKSLNPDQLQNYVQNRINTIVSELSALASHVVGNIPYFPSQAFSSGILLLRQVAINIGQKNNLLP